MQEEPKTNLSSKPISAEEDALINQEFERLLLDYAHTRKGDKSDLIRQVFEFAKKVHGNSRRLSGDPYICHPLAVARIVCNEIGLGSTSISAALLHDVVKNTSTTFEDLEQTFGPRITSLVRGLTKISGGNLRFVTEGTDDEKHQAIKNPEEQAENFRNLLLTMSEDVRVILVKIADRLHNMRTLYALEPLKQRRIASETIYLYAPLAYRLGLYNIKTELEDLSLRYDHPEVYAELKKKLQDSEEGRQRIFTTFSAPIISMLDGLGMKYEFKCRMKSIYSIWHKMQVKHIPFEEVYDLYAARIVFKPSSEENEKADCWRIYTAITSVYKIHPDRIRDWISRPKSNGYEALHVTVMGPDGNWIEIQIRSERMNDIAERGFAAHWKYKRGDQVVEGDNELDKWVKNIKDILDNPAPNALDFLDTIKLNLLSKEIYVFTPKGELQELPKGATALDFAFALHTNIGMHAEAAYINHQLMPINTVLKSGQQVEIQASENVKTSEVWRGWVTTAKARCKVQAYLNRQRQMVVDKGEGMLNDYLSKNNLLLDNPTMITLLNHYHLQKWDELFFKFGNGDLQINDSIKKLVKPKKQNILLGFFGIGKKKNKTSTITKSESDVHVPTQNDIAIQSSNTPSKAIAQNNAATSTEEESKLQKCTTIELKGVDGRGLLNTITRVISETLTVDIVNVHLECKEGLFKGYLTLDSNNTAEVDKVCTALRKIHEIKKAVRIH